VLAVVVGVQVCNMFIVSLAIADLIVGLVVMPMSTVYIFTVDWRFGVALCRPASDRHESTVASTDRTFGLQTTWSCVGLEVLVVLVSSWSSNPSRLLLDSLVSVLLGLVLRRLSPLASLVRARVLAWLELALGSGRGLSEYTAEVIVYG